MHQVLYRKWRPMKFSEVVGQEHVTEILKNQIKAGSFAHAYLFCGTRGSGKTTCARILSRAVNCLSPVEGEPCGKCSACLDISENSSLDITEIDAASNNGVSDIRALRDESVFTPSSLKMRVYIIDEVHMLSTAAFNALLKVLEEPPAHILFILATTEIHKVPATILSRCQRFDFRRIPVEAIEKRLEAVCSAEGFEVDAKALAIISRLADGALRNALSLLEQALGAKKSLTGDEALAALGLINGGELTDIGRLILSNDLPALFSKAGAMYESGLEVSAFFDELFVLMRDMMMIRALGRGASLAGAGYDYEDISSLASDFPTDRLVWSMRVIEECAAKVSGGLSKRALLELCLFRLANPSGRDDTGSLALRVSELERALSSGQKPLAREPSSAPVTSSSPAESRRKPAETATAEVSDDQSSSNDMPEVETADIPDLAERMTDALDGKLEVMCYIHFKRCALSVSGDTLKIICPGDFDREQLNHHAVTGAISDEASGILGFRPKIEFSIKGSSQPKAKAPSKTGDSLDLLASLQNEFDDVVTIV